MTIVDRKPQLRQEPDVEILHEDILKSARLDPLIEESEVVIHLAGSLGTEGTFSSLRATAENNVVATARVIESCLAVRRRAVYLTVGNNWRNPYTITRRCAAELGIMANLECGGDFRILKVMNAYGPWQVFDLAQKIIPTFCRQCMLDAPINIYGDGNQCIDLIHAEDVAVAVLLASAIDDLPHDRDIEVGTSIPRRVLEIANMVREITKSRSVLRFVGRRKGEPIHSVTLATDDTLKRASDFEPRIPLEEGLESTCQWYAENSSYLNLNSSEMAEMIEN